jgi:hypothetical protein
MDTTNPEFRCVIDGYRYDKLETIAMHLRMQHNVKRIELYVDRQR